MRRRQTKGAALVEFVFFLPLLFVLVLGTAELASAVFLKESLTIAAYEGNRVAIEIGSTNAEVTARIQQVLDDRGITNYQIDITPADLSTALPEDDIEVTVSAPYAENIVFDGSLLFGNRQAEGTCIMMKE